ncbi:hypothetical protein EIL87_19810 [Saccharopolyspora rhizosphaerae]|uniref:Uncharacterized protein n=1 Tax=Saccharopolyspora rhizosphaerae TaxID=2492662 RepID=A0A3R8P1L5_9PSEU|nr:hypothetical protein [Saccharopolyspora rhizosphaerae]RRO14552.1 hypothetical protein EIL87_19810 [Saccharopolyspora rhizosphaerae]
MTSASCSARTRSGRSCMIGTEDDSGLCHIHNPDRHCGAVPAGGSTCTMQAGSTGFCWKHEPPRPRAVGAPDLHGSYGQPGQPVGPLNPAPVAGVGDPLGAAKAVRTATRNLVLGAGRVVEVDTTTGAAILCVLSEAVRDLGALGWQATGDDAIRRAAADLASQIEAHTDRRTS